MNEVLRVPYDDILYTSDHLYVLDGGPFTGVGIEVDGGGQEICEVPFVDGQQHGVARDRYPSGQLRGETPYVRGLRHGTEREWHESGQLRQESVFEFDVLMSSSTYSESGELIEEFKRCPDDDLARLVAQRRAAEGRAPIDPRA